MKILNLPFLIKNHWLIAKRKSRYQQRNQGFTLIEILVAMIMGSIILSSLLWLMTNILEDNQKENARSQTQQEMRMALDYMTEELREAVYIYDGNSLKQLVTDNYLPDFGSRQPIIAFWKVETVPYNSTDSIPSNCNSFSEPTKSECEALQIEQKSYTLVVYLLSEEQPANDNQYWSGQSRIERYQLRKYQNVSRLTRSSGYADPGRNSESSFAGWPLDKNGKAPTERPVANTPETAPEALADFVYWDTTMPANLTACPDNTATYVYQQTPDNPTNNLGFYACVGYEAQDANPKDGVADDVKPNNGDGIPDRASTQNQTVIIYLKGNAKGKPGISNNSVSSLLSAQVHVKGVLEGTTD